MKRNLKRFPADFMFQLAREELEISRCQIGTSRIWGGRRYPPYVFTEHGAVTLVSVLNSQRAVEASIFVVRAFVRLREFLICAQRIIPEIGGIRIQNGYQVLQARQGDTGHNRSHPPFDAPPRKSRRNKSIFERTDRAGRCFRIPDQVRIGNSYLSGRQWSSKALWRPIGTATLHFFCDFEPIASCELWVSGRDLHRASWITPQSIPYFPPWLMTMSIFVDSTIANNSFCSVSGTANLSSDFLKSASIACHSFSVMLR